MCTLCKRFPLAHSCIALPRTHHTTATDMSPLQHQIVSALLWVPASHCRATDLTLWPRADLRACPLPPVASAWISRSRVALPDCLESMARAVCFCADHGMASGGIQQRRTKEGDECGPGLTYYTEGCGSSPCQHLDCTHTRLMNKNRSNSCMYC